MLCFVAVIQKTVFGFLLRSNNLFLFCSYDWKTFFLFNRKDEQDGWMLCVCVLLIRWKKMNNSNQLFYYYCRSWYCLFNVTMSLFILLGWYHATITNKISSLMIYLNKEMVYMLYQQRFTLSHIELDISDYC